MKFIYILFVGIILGGFGGYLCFMKYYNMPVPLTANLFNEDYPISNDDYSEINDAIKKHTKDQEYIYIFPNSMGKSTILAYKNRDLNGMTSERFSEILKIISQEVNKYNTLKKSKGSSKGSVPTFKH